MRPSKVHEDSCLRGRCRWMCMSWSHTLLTTRTFAKMRSSSWRNRSTLTRSLRAPGPNPRQSISAKATCWSRAFHRQLHPYYLIEGQWGSSVLLQHAQPGIHVADKLVHDCGQMLGFHQFWSRRCHVSQQSSFAIISMQKWRLRLRKLLQEQGLLGSDACICGPVGSAGVLQLSRSLGQATRNRR